MASSILIRCSSKVEIQILTLEGPYPQELAAESADSITDLANSIPELADSTNDSVIISLSNMFNILNPLRPVPTRQLLLDWPTANRFSGYRSRPLLGHCKKDDIPKLNYMK